MFAKSQKLARAVDGDDDAGEQLLNDFFEKHGNDEYLFKSV